MTSEASCAALGLASEHFSPTDPFGERLPGRPPGGSPVAPLLAARALGRQAGSPFGAAPAIGPPEWPALGELRDQALDLLDVEGLPHRADDAGQLAEPLRVDERGHDDDLEVRPIRTLPQVVEEG